MLANTNEMESCCCEIDGYGYIFLVLLNLCCFYILSHICNYPTKYTKWKRPATCPPVLPTHQISLFLYMNAGLFKDIYDYC